MRKEKVDAITYRFFKLILLLGIHAAEDSPNFFEITFRFR